MSGKGTENKGKKINTNIGKEKSGKGADGKAREWSDWKREEKGVNKKTALDGRNSCGLE